MGKQASHRHRRILWRHLTHTWHIPLLRSLLLWGLWELSGQVGPAWVRLMPWVVWGWLRILSPTHDGRHLDLPRRWWVLYNHPPVMRVNEFLQGIAEHTRRALPVDYRDFKSRRRSSLIQIWYSQPKIHYEVWVQGRRNRIEVGLHLEAKKTLNDRVLQHLAERFVAIQAQLGPAVELEQWTQSWGRVHRFVPYDRLDESLCRAVAEELVRMIVALEPLCAEAVARRMPG